MVRTSHLAPRNARSRSGDATSRDKRACVRARVCERVWVCAGEGDYSRVCAQIVPIITPSKSTDAYRTVQRMDLASRVESVRVRARCWNCPIDPLARCLRFQSFPHRLAHSRLRTLHPSFILLLDVRIQNCVFVARNHIIAMAMSGPRSGRDSPSRSS